MSDPSFEGVLESALYYPHAEREATLAFYERTLGLPRVAGWDDGTAFRVGAGVLLLFDREHLAVREGPISAHGADGPGHVCFLARGEEYEDWLEWLGGAGVEITHEQEWPRGGRSFYFADTAGNLLEVADRELWPAS